MLKAWLKNGIYTIIDWLSALTLCIQCFDAVGWAAGGHPACKKPWGGGLCVGGCLHYLPLLHKNPEDSESGCGGAHPDCRYLCFHYLPLQHKNPEDRRWGNPAWMQHSPMLRQKAECLFWYRPTQVVPEERPLNGCCCCCCCCKWSIAYCQIILMSKAPMQVDGEPWEQPPATMTITHYNQACLLASPAAL